MFSLSAVEKKWFLVAWIIVLLASLIGVKRAYRVFYDKQDVRSFQLASLYPVRDLSSDQAVQQYLSRHPVYVALSTTPDRIIHLPRVLAALDLKNVTKLWVVIPQKFRQQAAYTIPQELLSHPKVAIMRLQDDLGPISKSLPVIRYAQQHDPRALIITIDDDYFYPKGVVNEHIYALVHNSKIVSSAVIASLGGAKTRAPVHYHVRANAMLKYKQDVLRWLVQGVGSVGFVAGDIDLKRLNAVVDYVVGHNDNACFFADDVVMSYILKGSGVSPRLLFTQYLRHAWLKPFWENQVADAISNMGLYRDIGSYFRHSTDNNARRIERCLAILQGFEQTYD